MPTKKNRGRTPDATDNPPSQAQTTNSQTASDRPRLVLASTVGDLRRSLEAVKATWQVAKSLRDNAPLPRYPLGGATQTFVPSNSAPPVDWTKLGRTLPSDPQLIARRLELGLVPEDLVDLAKRTVELHRQPTKKHASRKKKQIRRK
ncbi:MAG TPA: hypothetical protein VMS18_18605 [Candidatus Binatia bacterium]|nr:hypothetical protein [Candidatus Binatia bacterium]